MKQFAVVFSLALALPAALARSATGAELRSVNTGNRSTSAYLSQIATKPGNGSVFTCGSLRCTCTGDEDCNDMFSNKSVRRYCSML